MEIGQVICALRKERKLTQEEVALSAGTDAGYLSRIERGNRLPSIPLFENIASALGTRPSIIFAVAEGVAFPDSSTTERITGFDLDLSEDAIRLRQEFRGLTNTNQRIAVELLRALKRTQA
ncbi:MAG: helix-turn-helix transcriptional regulator [Thiobacillus sp.]|nr:helix-turn-helix transcriptional regulator [Thiobacillus sp.]